MEILLFTTVLHSHQSSNKSRNEEVLLDVFLKPKEIAEMASGLRYFLKKVVSKSDITASKMDRAKVKWGCKVACDGLSAMVHNNSAVGE